MIVIYDSRAVRLEIKPQLEFIIVNYNHGGFKRFTIVHFFAKQFIGLSKNWI